MKSISRVILTFFTFIASFYFFFWIPSFLKTGPFKIVTALLIAILIAIFLWKKLGKSNSGLLIYIITGGIVTGSVCFILGFIGPVIIAPSNNLGPLLGLLYTGPIGFILGSIGGAIYWKIKRSKNSSL
jgi:hypothetical protein